MDNIIIDKNLKFVYEDLTKQVNLSHAFTLGDVIEACMNSNVTYSILCRILRCNHIEDYYKEMKSKKSNKKDSEVEYLELYLEATKDNDGDSIGWGFHGIGYKGKISKDIRFLAKEWDDKKKKEYRENYAIEFSPIYKLASLPIKIRPYIQVTDYDDASVQEAISITPSITLIELLEAIFYELSWAGNPKQRDAQLKDLREKAKNIKKSNSVSYEKVKKDLLEKYRNI